MRILVAEPVAREGVELLAAHHEVDERTGCTREELAAILPEYDALVVRSQVQVDADVVDVGWEDDDSAGDQLARRDRVVALAHRVEALDLLFGLIARFELGDVRPHEAVAR